jgi:hypothetical protein
VILAAALALCVADDGVAQPQPMSNRCFTPRFWCWMPVFAPIRSPCFCGTPYGNVQGIVG